MKNLIIIIVCIFSQAFFGQTPNELFDQANLAFKNGQYEKSINLYNSIEKSGYQSDVLYYNLGNAYYKLNKIAPSIYNYEKSLLINPTNTDAQNNLNFAKRMAIDVIEPMPKTLFQKINESIIYSVSYNNWAIINIVFAFLSIAFFIMYFFSSFETKKRTFFVLTFVGFGLFLITLSMGIKARHHFVNDQPAIVFEPKASVKSEPGFNSNEIFELHEGTKVQILDQIENWYKIKISDGKTGWINRNQVKKLKE